MMQNERVDFLMLNSDTQKDELKAFGFEKVPKIQLFVFPDDYRESVRDLADTIDLSHRNLFNDTAASSVTLIRWVRTHLFESSILQVCTGVFQSVYVFLVFLCTVISNIHLLHRIHICACVCLVDGEFQPPVRSGCGRT